ncbi:MAG: hypothetical protein AB7U40_08380, partial [Methanobacteriales archaeon]
FFRKGEQKGVILHERCSMISDTSDKSDKSDTIVHTKFRLEKKGGYGFGRVGRRLARADNTTRP